MVPWEPMKVVTLNASPYGARGNVGRLLTAFTSGLEDAGCEVTGFAVPKLDIKPCRGALLCWHTRGERCVHTDDMTRINDAMETAGLLVLATPLYVDGMTGALKTVLDRMVRRVSASVELRDGRLRHLDTSNGNRTAIVLIATCGLWRMDNFDPLVAHVRAVSRSHNSPFAGSLLRPHAPSVLTLGVDSPPVQAVLEGARRAGREMAADRAMSDEAVAAVSRPLMDIEAYRDVFNGLFPAAPAS